MTEQQPAEPQERKTKRQRFEEVAPVRVEKVLKAIKSLSRCGNTTLYEYSDEERKKIFEAVGNALVRCEQEFDDAGIQTKFTL